MARTSIFDNFDFSLLQSGEFHEDSVREELIVPILQQLGYSASGENRIIRSKRLEHPFVSFGTKSSRISIIPDYLLQVNRKNMWILDAKNPKENIHSGKGVEQAFSYAMHRDVRVHLYALCNGSDFVLFHVSELEPVLCFKLANIEDFWEDLYRAVSPLGLTHPQLLDYQPDLGIALLKFGFSNGLNLHFPFAQLYSFGRVSDEIFTAFSSCDYGDGPLAISFDFDRSRFRELLRILPGRQGETLKERLMNQPFVVHLPKEDPALVHVSAKLGNTLQRGRNQAFVPLEVNAFEAPIRGDSPRS